jgi:SAM-dependent methyltransferase
MMDQRILIDTAVELNLVPNEYFTLWNDLADWQLETLKAAGLRPEHKLLDIGCGAMRLGFSAVEYLDEDNEYGVDAFQPYLAMAERLATKLDIKKKFTVRASESFDFESFAMRFHYANAQSVFTHLSAEQCDRCMESLGRVMMPGGRFLFTYLIGTPVTQGFAYGGRMPMQRLAISGADFFVDVGKRHGARFQSLEAAHPTGQRVGLFEYPD